MGISDKNENCDEVGQSATQRCRSYIFTIGNRKLRLVDALGIGDVRGIDQDKENCDHILSYISQYKYLNGICILFKPNIERFTISFRFCFKEILTHLHVNAKDNLMFIFTNGRSTFYRPGSSAALIRNLLVDLQKTWLIDVPFDSTNSEEETSRYDTSWMKSVGEFTRLIERILKCDRYAVRDSLSINSAQQLIRQLTPTKYSTWRKL